MSITAKRMASRIANRIGKRLSQPSDRPFSPAAVSFDGVDDYASRTGLSSLFSSSFTLEFVVHDFTYAISKYFVTVDGSAFQVFIPSTNAGCIAIGNTSGWKWFSIGTIDSDYVGKWRFVYDTAETDFARYRVYLNDVELIGGGTQGTFAEISISTGAMALALRNGAYAACTLSSVRFWASVVDPGDSEASPAIDLTTVDDTTWADASGNSRDFTLQGGAEGVRTRSLSLSLLDNQVVQRDMASVVTFDGTGDYASASLPISLFAGSFTYEFQISAFTYAISKYFLSINNTQLQIFIPSTNPGCIAIGNNSGWKWFSVGTAGANYVGKWRFVYDASRTGFARYRIFFNDVEVEGSTQATFAAVSVTISAVTAIAGRPALSSYTDCDISNVRLWSSALVPGDSEASPELQLSTVSGTTWTDASGNGRDFTLQADAAELSQVTGITTVPVAITYIGNPNNIRARYNGSNWETVEASPASGAGCVIWNLVTDDPSGDLEVVVGNQRQTVSIAIGDVYLLPGDSRAEGRGTSAQSYTGTQPAYVFRQDRAWKAASDPFDTGTSSGSHWPLLASLQDSDGVPLGFVSVGTGSQDIAGGNTAYAKSNASYVMVVNQARRAGGRFKAALVMFGPNAATATIDTATYLAAIQQFASDIRADVQAAIPIYWDIFGESSSYASNDAVRQAVIDAYDAGDVLPGPNLIGDNYADNVHPKTSAELATVAARWWLALEGTRGPVLSSASIATGDDTITLTFDKDLETTDSTYTAAAFEVKDNGIAKTISSVSRTGARTVDIVLSSVIGSATILVSFAKDTTFLGATMPRSVLTALPVTINGVSTAAQPAEPFIDFAVTVV